MSRRPWNAPRFGADLLDVFTLPVGNPRTVTVLKASQVGYTSLACASLAYWLEERAARVTVFQPSDKVARDFGKDTVGPVFEANAGLAALGETADKRLATLTLRMLTNGGLLRCLGAKAAANFRRYGAEFVILDELDGYEPEIGNPPEGGPVSLASRATRNTDGRVVCGSTPTLEGISQTEREVERADLVFDFAVRCPECGELDVLCWERMAFDGEGDIATRAASVRHACGQCGAEWTYDKLPGALRGGRWQTEDGAWIAPGGTLQGASWPENVAFRVWAAYSPWWSWSKMVAQWLRAQGDPAALKVFVTTVLARTWRDAEVFVEEAALKEAAENLATLPEDALVGILSVDVQDGWLSALVTAWGPDEECWIVERREFHGAVDTADGDGWTGLFDWLRSGPSWERETGSPLRIDLSALDCAYLSDVSYTAALKWPGRCMPVRGVGGFDRPALTLPARKTKTKNGRTVPLYLVGVDQAKITTVGRLAAGRIHLADSLPDTVFAELAAERLVSRRIRGRERQSWEKVTQRNEALDQCNYALAAIRRRNPTWGAVAARMATGKPAAVVELKRPEEPAPEPPKPKVKRDPVLDGFRAQRRRQRSGSRL